MNGIDQDLTEFFSGCLLVLWDFF